MPWAREPVGAVLSAVLVPFRCQRLGPSELGLEAKAFTWGSVPVPWGNPLSTPVGATPVSLQRGVPAFPEHSAGSSLGSVGPKGKWQWRPPGLPWA